MVGPVHRDRFSVHELGAAVVREARGTSFLRRINDRSLPEREEVTVLPVRLQGEAKKKANVERRRR